MLLELIVPLGVAPGEMIEFEHDGTLFNAAVPPGLSVGDSFQIEVGGADHQPHTTEAPRAAAKPVELGHYLQARAASGDLMDRFALWFEENDIEEEFEAFIASHAHIVRGASESSSTEHAHEWWPIYQAYQAKFDVLLERFLSEAGCSAQEFVSAAESASGMNDIILRIFLSSSEYETFINFLVDAVNGTSGT